MAGWVLVPSLRSLREEFDEVAPRRDKSSDGAVGDTRHGASSSDHNPDETGNTPSEDADSINEVHAIDVDNSGPWPAGFSMQRAVERIVLRHRSGDDDRLQNVIYNRRIWSRSWGWTARAYSGDNPHDHHAHFSARYTVAAESSIRPWGLLELLEDTVPLTDADVDRILNRDTVPNLYGDAKKNPSITVKNALKASVSADVKADRILVLLGQLAGRDFTDEDAIVSGILAGLSPEQLERLIRTGMSSEQRHALAARLAA